MEQMVLFLAWVLPKASGSSVLVVRAYPGKLLFAERCWGPFSPSLPLAL